MEPNLTIGNFATAVKVATMMKFGGHASPAEAALFWPQFQSLKMSPEEFQHTLDRLAPLSYAYHGRPPTLGEVAQLREKSPREARQYFGDLPDKHYPQVSAADMVKTLAAAKPHAQEHLGRPPVKNEAVYLHFSGESPAEYYQRLKPPSPTALAGNTMPQSADGLQTQSQRDSGGRGVAAARRPPADQ